METFGTQWGIERFRKPRQLFSIHSKQRSVERHKALDVGRYKHSQL